MRYWAFCGKKTSVIALGTMDFGGRIESSRAFDLMDAYVDAGGNFLDTARAYGDPMKDSKGGSEEVIGRWLDARRNHGGILLGTKGGFPDAKDKSISRLDHASVLSDMQKSLEALRSDCVDIYWLHRDDPTRHVGDIMETFADLYERKMLKYIGVSNWTEERITEANAYAQTHGLVPIYANQPQFSLARQVNVEDPTLCQMDSGMYAMHVESGMPCVCFTSQAKGFMSKMAAGGADLLSEKARRRYYAEENLQRLERVKQLASQLGVSVNSVTLAWLTSQPFPCCPIAGVSRMEHVEALREAGDIVLSPQQRDFLRKL